MDNPRSLLSLKQVQNRVPFCRSTIYAMMDKGTFPQSIKIGESRVAWDSMAIDRWIEEKISA